MELQQKASVWPSWKAMGQEKDNSSSHLRALRRAFNKRAQERPLHLERFATETN